jgi:hypothetical protein
MRAASGQLALFELSGCVAPALHLQVTKVELLLNYEGSVDYPLAIGSIDNFLLELAVHPATLQVWHT